MNNPGFVAGGLWLGDPAAPGRRTGRPLRDLQAKGRWLGWIVIAPAGAFGDRAVLAALLTARLRQLRGEKDLAYLIDTYKAPQLSQSPTQQREINSSVVPNHQRSGVRPSVQTRTFGPPSGSVWTDGLTPRSHPGIKKDFTTLAVAISQR